MKPATRPLLLAGTLLAAGCGHEEPPPEPPPPLELAPVVQPAFQELEAELALPDPPPETGAEEVDGLVTVVAGSDAAMQRVGLEEARGLGDACLPELVRVAQDTDRDEAERRAALQLLGSLDTVRSATALLEMAESAKEPWIRAHAAWRLCEGTQDWIVPRLYLRLKYEPDHQTVVWLNRTLGHFGIYTGLLVLNVVASESPDETQRASAAARMGEITAEAGFADVGALWDAWVGGEAHDAFQPERSRRYDLEVWRMLARFPEFQLRGVDDSRYVLSALDAHAAEIMARALHDEDVYVRVNTAQSLQRMGPRAAPAGPALLEGLRDPALAPIAAAALGAIRFAPAEAVLAGELVPATAAELRLAAARALGGFGGDASPAAANALRALLAQAEPEELRQAAAESLAYRGHGDEVAALLCQLLGSPRIEPVSSEAALRFWLASRADAGSETAARVLAAWDELVIPNDAIVPAEDKRKSREARRTLVEDALPDLVPDGRAAASSGAEVGAPPR